MIEPFGERVIIKHEEIKSKSGIIISGTKESPTNGVIVSINKATSEKYNLKVNDKINFGQHRSVKLIIDSEEFHIIEIKEAFGVYR